MNWKRPRRCFPSACALRTHVRRNARPDCPATIRRACPRLDEISWMLSVSLKLHRGHLFALLRHPNVATKVHRRAGGAAVPSKHTVRKAKQKLREGKSPKTAAGEFVHEEIEHVRQGKHGARSPRQAIAIGLSEARRGGIPVPPPKKNASAATKKKAERDYEKGQSSRSSVKKKSGKRSKARLEALQREPKNTASHAALSRQAKAAAKRRPSTSRRKAA